jgi:type II secretory ATPase GspE/PulE/Tfp pilus assembly ATPase PilB-like protein
MILVTGPTGSGKTSTLYSCMSLINSLETNITTIEDPVEYQLPGVNQVAVNPEIHMGFAQGLRAILRQDPDVIMVGEIRDAETAAIGIRAAMTGHLVFSTLHTNTALGAYVTLQHMGAPTYMAAEAILALVAQRLVRKICEECRAPHAPDEEIVRKMWPKGEKPDQFFHGKGCDVCLGSGYKGRVGLFEVVESTAALRNLAARGALEEELVKQATKLNHISLLDVGRERIRDGVTTLEEVVFQTMALGRE